MGIGLGIFLLVVGAVLRYDGIPPYPETQNYVRSIMTELGRS